MTAALYMEEVFEHVPVMCVQVPVGDNYYAALNSAVFSDGSFVYIPKGVKSAMELSTYFRINAQETGQVRTPGCSRPCNSAQ